MLQVSRDLSTLWATLQPPSECSSQQREGLLLEVAIASAAAHATWQAQQHALTQVHLHCVRKVREVYIWRHSWSLNFRSSPDCCLGTTVLIQLANFVLSQKRQGVA